MRRFLASLASREDWALLGLLAATVAAVSLLRPAFLRPDNLLRCRASSSRPASSLWP